MFRMIVHLIRSRPADKPGSVVGGHLSGTAVARRLMRPTRGSDGTGRPVQEQPQGLPLRRPCLALLPVGVAWPPGSPRTPVVSYTTFSPLPGREDGGLVSGILVDWYLVCGESAGCAHPTHSPFTHLPAYPLPTRRSVSAALSVGLPRLGVTQHRALWSPDFPHPAHGAERDRLADLEQLHLNILPSPCQAMVP